MQTGKFRRILIIAGVTSLFLSYLGIWSRFINDPAERTGSDFIAFYTAGRIAQNQGAEDVYDPRLQQEVQQEEVGFPLAPGQVLLYNHLPFLIPLLRMVVSADYVASFYRWVTFLLTLYVAGVIVLSRVLREMAIDRASVFLTTIGALLFLPLFFSLMNGQDTALLFLGTAVWVYGLISGKEYLAGLGLSLTTVRPHIALFLAIPMLFRYPKVFLTFLLGSGSLAILSVMILGWEGTRDFLDILLLSAGGEWYGMKENAMYNLIGLLTRIVPYLGADVIRIFGWIVYGMTIMGLCIVWYKTRTGNRIPVGLSVTLALFVSPHLHFHDLALLLFPIYELIRMSKETGRLAISTVIAMPIAVSLLFLISNISPYLQYTIPYLTMLVLAIYPYESALRGPATIPHQS